MTTIAYHHKDKQVAVDSRAVSSDIINTDRYNKSIKNKNGIYILCGSAGNYQKFIDEYESGEKPSGLEVWGFLIKKRKVYKIVDGKNAYIDIHLTWNEGMGSGAELAIAAMDFGKSAKEAVQYAAKRDIYTGGRIRVFNV